MSEAAKAIEASQYKKAITLCNVAIELHEGEEAYYYLGMAYLGDHDEANAKSAFVSLKDNYPESSHIEDIAEYLNEQ